MKKSQVKEIMAKWSADYLSRGFSTEISSAYLSYAESLIKRDLPPIFDLRHLSTLIGIDYGFLVKVAFGTKSFYREFKIPKRSGGYRTIKAPYQSLLFVQRWIYKNILFNQKTQFCAHGFVPNRSILSNAIEHKECRMLLKLDIKNFFDSIPIAFVINYFHKELGYNSEVSYFLAKICCLDDVLPQGAPTSPALSNLISISLDRRLYRLAKYFNLKYTRYADDIAFSGEKIPAILISYVENILSDCNLKINGQKTRLYSVGGSKIIAGVSVANGNPRVTRDFRRKLRQDLHFIEKYGLNGHMRHNSIKQCNYIERLIGKLNFWLFIEPDNSYAFRMKTKLRQIYNETLD